MKLAKKFVLLLNKLYLGVLATFAILLSFWVFVSTYESVREEEAISSRSSSGYYLARPLLDDWKTLRIVGLTFLLPGVLLSILTLILYIKRKRPYRGILSCSLWIFVMVILLFSFAIGALFIDLVLMGRKV